MQIKILGSGCAKCRELAKNVEQAVEELKIAASVEKVTDILQIRNYEMLSTPALVVGEVVRSQGRVLKTSEVIEILKTECGH